MLAHSVGISKWMDDILWVCTINWKSRFGFFPRTRTTNLIQVCRSVDSAPLWCSAGVRVKTCV